MMYFAHEMSRAALMPLRMMTDTQSKLLRHPLSPRPACRALAVLPQPTVYLAI